MLVSVLTCVDLPIPNDLCEIKKKMSDEDEVPLPAERYVGNRRIGREVARELERRRELERLHPDRGESSGSSSSSSTSSQGEEQMFEEEVLSEPRSTPEGERSEIEDSASRSSESEVSGTGSSDEEREGGEEEDEGDEEGYEEDGNEANREELGGGEQEEMDDTTFLRETLRRWAADGGAASMRKLDMLLRNLAVRFEGLPLSYKTLLQTPRRIEVANLNHGSVLWYKGIREQLDAMDLEPYLRRYGRVIININMDGLMLSKSSAMKFWPILGFLVGSENQPFVIAIYLGKKDPDDVYAYLHDLTLELNSLQQNGYTHNGTVYPFAVKDYILDAPARSLIKCCVLFNSYCSCEKCCVEGEFIADRMTYCRLDAALRTDESYNNQEQPQHHIGISPLQEIGTGMVSQFRLDPLHLIYLGVFKRLLQVWLYWNGNFRLHWTSVNAMSDMLMTLQPTRPCDFNRAIRGFQYFKHFKATEFRRMCHYDSILIFRDNINNNVYRHFLLLYVGLFILAHPVFAPIQEWRDYAHELLTNFINHSIEIYGAEFVVYNVHCLSHLASECEQGNCSLDDFSAFMFETALGSIKNTLKSFYMPCQQAACRISEKLHFVQEVKLPSEHLNVSLSMEYRNEDGHLPGRHFQRISIGKFVLQLNGKDQYFQVRNGDLVLLSDIVRTIDGAIHLVGNRFLQRNDFFDYPLPSSQLGIFGVANPPEEHANVYDVEDVVAKYWFMPDGDMFCCFTVVKFLDQTEASYDIGLEKWLFDFNPDLNEGQTYWPPIEKNVQKYVMRQQSAEELTWKKFRVKVKRFKGTYEEAKEYLRGVLSHSSNYETERDFGRGRRKRKAKKFTDSESEDDPKGRPPPKLNKTKPIPAPPAINKFNPPIKSREVKNKNSRAKNHTKSLSKFMGNTTSSRDLLLSKLKDQKSKSSEPNPKTSLHRNLSSKEQQSHKVKSASVGSFSHAASNAESSSVSRKGDSSPETDADNTSSISPYRNQSAVQHLIGSDKSSGLSLGPSSSCDTVIPAPMSCGEDSLRLNYKVLGADAASRSKALSRAVETTVQVVSGSSKTPPCDGQAKPSLENTTTIAGISGKRSASLSSSVESSPESISVIPVKKSQKKPCTAMDNDFTSLRDTFLRDCRSPLLDRGSGSEVGQYESFAEETNSVSPAHSITHSPRNSLNELSTNMGSPNSSIRHHSRGSSIDKENIQKTGPTAGSRGSVVVSHWIESDIVTIRKQVEGLRRDVQEGNLNLSRLTRFLMPHEKRLKLPANMPTLPLDSHEKFDKFEEFLDEQINLDAVIEYLSLLPIGKKEGQGAMNLMAKVLSNGLASAYNFDGHGWKLGFKETAAWKAVQGALSIQFPGSTLEEAIKQVRSWLRNAPGREGGKSAEFFKDKMKK